jgi:hypothetical protein
VRELQPGQTYEIDTPNLALLLQQPGEYRVEVNDAGDRTVVKVSQGAALASGAGQNVPISAQQAVSFSGTDTLAYSRATLGAPDALDSWSAERERFAEDSPSRQYVADEVAGTQDLDNNGTWTSTPDYGYVWMPTAVAVGWVPYRFGHWVWIAPWGWSWIDDARWGYAPFHYGRWVQYHETWCWVPGPRRGHPVYAPALVGWVNGPSMSGPAAMASPVAWFPLGPRELYVPAYAVSQTYVRNVNITNTTVVNNLYISDVYEHRLTPLHYANNTSAAVTAVPESVFVSGERVGGRAVRVAPAALAAATVAAAAPAIAPIRQSVLGPDLGRGAARPRTAFFSHAVVARTAPPRAPAPLERQMAAIQANGGRPLARAELSRLQPDGPAAPVRLIDATGAVAAAGPSRGGGVSAPVAGGLARERRSGSGDAAPPEPGARPVPNAPTPTLTERERALQSNRVTGTPPSGQVLPAAARADEYVPPAPPAAARDVSPGAQWRSDRPGSPEPHPPGAQPRTFEAGDPSHTPAEPPSPPVYRLPPPLPAGTTRQPAPAAAAGRPAGAPELPRRESGVPAGLPRPAPPVERVSPRTAPASRPSESEPRGAGPHADRESRERGQR